MSDSLSMIGGLSILFIGLGGLISAFSIMMDLFQKKRLRLWSVLSFLIAVVALIPFISLKNASSNDEGIVRFVIVIIAAVLIFVFLILDRMQLEKRDKLDQLKREQSAYKITADYSYARDRLTSHAKNEGNLKEILEDVFRVIDEYASSSVSKTVGPYKYIEMTRFLAEMMAASITLAKMLQDKGQMMEPILAGLKKLVLISDCGVKESEIPDDVKKILALNGPKEVDEVIAFLREQRFI